MPVSDPVAASPDGVGTNSVRGPEEAPDATPFHFGPSQAPLFGWLHAPRAFTDAGACSHAVVLCHAFGSEELSAHRAWRRLAQLLANRGHWVLRFDYHATGDSAGGVSEDGLVSAWIDSIRAAIDEIKRASGRAQIVLVGLRLGAALAWLAAKGRPDVIGWAGVAPTLSGRQHVRELHALQAAAGLLDTMPPDQGLESGGFVMSAATRDAVAAVDVRLPREASVTHALIVPRPGHAVPSSMSEALAGLGVAVVNGVGSDLETIFAEPHQCVTPESTWHEVLAWVDALPAPRRSASQPISANRPASFDGVFEQHEFISSRTGRLSAIATWSDQVQSSGRAIIFLNAGAIRRIGPGGFHVDLARDLARQGHLAVRLDLCGLGDSDVVAGGGDTIVYSPTAIGEVTDAVKDVLARPNISECAIVGLCSGAYHGVRAAFSGSGVRTVVAINPLTYYWEQGQTLEAAPRPHEVISEAARYRSIVFTLEPWLKLLRGKAHVRRMVQLLLRSATRHVVRWGRDLGRTLGVALQHDLGRELKSASERGVQIRFIFAEGEPGEPLLKDLAGATVTRLLNEGKLGLQMVPRADHVFLNLKPRKRLIELIRGALGTD